MFRELHKCFVKYKKSFFEKTPNVLWNEQNISKNNAQNVSSNTQKFPKNCSK